MKKTFVALTAVTALLTLVAGSASAVIPGVGAVSKKNIDWVFNWEQGAGSDIEFVEMGAGATLKRYAVVGSMSNGFNMIDITNPALPIPAGAYLDPGVNWQGDIQVNSKRKIVALATESPGTTASHSGDGVVFVDIANPLQPKMLGQVPASAHNVVLINDQYAYTIGTSQIIDYSNASAPVMKGPIPGMCSGHDITVDPNRPHIVYNACSNTKTEIHDVTNPLKPVKLSTITDTKISIAHEADPNLDSSLLFIGDERGGGLSNTTAPGGGLHVWDISGKYVAGASITTPKKLGAWFAPFYGANGTPQSGTTWGNVTSHCMNFQSERNMLAVAWYSMGTFVADMNAATVATGGQYTEYKGTVNGGPTSWGNSMGNIILEGDDVWASKWATFDDPLYERYIFTNGLTRGFDVLRYTGPMTKKHSRLAVDGTATAKAISGKLDRYAVLTPTGDVNKPLAAKELTIKVAGGPTLTATTGPDGSFSAPSTLAAGTYQVEVSWAGDAIYRTETVTQSVTV